MIIPTSQTTVHKGYFSYHTPLHQSPDLLRLVRTQIIIYVSFIMIIFFINICTCTLLENNQIFIEVSESTSNLTNFTPASVSLARLNLIVHTSYAIPTGFLFSYLMVFLYFKMDAGYFSLSNMEFKYFAKKQNKRKGEYNIILDMILI